MPVKARSVVIWIVPLMLATSAAATSDLRLVEAVKNQNREAIRALLKQPIDVDARQPDGATALHWAAHRDDLDTVDLLIRAGARVNAANDLGVTPLALACTHGNAAIVEKLLTAGANPDATALPTEVTALMTAARAGSEGAVRALLAHGADVNAKETAHGQTALMWAVARRHPQVVRVLLEAGADVHARSQTTRMPVVRGDRFDVTDDRKRGREIAEGGFTPLLFAARQGDPDSARVLLGAGANVNDTAPQGTSALVVAVHSGHAALAVFLLDRGADPNAADAGYSALHLAVLRADLELVKALLAHGANPNVQLTQGTRVNKFSKDFALNESLVGATPFLLAARFLEIEIMRLLVASGADSRLTMRDGTTSLMAAAGLGMTVLDRGAGFGRDRREFRLDPTEVDLALKNRDWEERRALDAVTIAVDLGADVNEGNQTGNTALHGAASNRYDRVIQFLADRGAKVDVKNKRGQTPLMMTAGRRAQRVSTDYTTGTADLLRKLGAKE